MVTAMMVWTTTTPTTILQASTHLQARTTPACSTFPRLVTSAQGRSRCAVCVQECLMHLLVLHQYSNTWWSISCMRRKRSVRSVTILQVKSPALT